MFERKIKIYHFKHIKRSILTGYDIKPEDINVEEFKRVQRDEVRTKRRSQTKQNIMPPRNRRAPIDQDWGSVWPMAHSYNASVIPLPVRQGLPATRSKSSPVAFGNLELAKIPNFFHLTPTVIKEQCAALKKFCTPWPKGLESLYRFKGFIPISQQGIWAKTGVYDIPTMVKDNPFPPPLPNVFDEKQNPNFERNRNNDRNDKNDTIETANENQSLNNENSDKNSPYDRRLAKWLMAYKKEELHLNELISQYFPIEITTNDFCFSGPDIRDERSKFVTMKIKVTQLGFNYHGYDKLLRLIGGRKNLSRHHYLTLQSEVCPTRQQNIDYAYYLLTALYFESKKIEDWELESNGKTLQDFEAYFWHRRPSSTQVFKTLERIKRFNKDENVPQYFKSNPENIEVDDNKTLETQKEQLLHIPQIQNFAKAINKIHESPVETPELLQEYKERVHDLLGVPKFSISPNLNK